VRTLMELEDAVNSVTRAATKDMSKSSATAYNRVKMNLKKYINSNPALGLAADAEPGVFLDGAARLARGERQVHDACNIQYIGAGPVSTSIIYSTEPNP